MSVEPATPSSELLFEALPQAACVYDRETRRVLAANEALATTLGYPREHLIGLGVEDVYAPEDVPALREHLAHGAAGGDRSSCWTVRRRDGRELRVEIRARDIAYAGRPATLVVALDISELTDLERALRESEDLYRTVVSTISDGVWVTDGEHRTVFVNDRAAQMLGHPVEELLGRPPADFMHPQHQAAARARQSDRRRGVSDRHETVWLHADGTELWTTVSATPIRFGSDGRHHGTVAIITPLSDAERRLAHLAYHDNLTGLLNRTALTERLGGAVARAADESTAVALLYVDLVDFKRVNDSLGHDLGDQLLKEFAGRLQRIVRSSETLARHGGDEFLVMVDELPRDDRGDTARFAAEALSRRITNALREPIVLGGGEFQVQANVGISLFPYDAQDAGALLRHADTAMYSAKTSGGEYSVYVPTERDPLEPLALAARLRRAVERGELELHYQPVVRLRDRRLVGVEALVRWRDPERGLIPPDAFVPVAEKTGLIDAIGRDVLERGCADGRRWLAAGLMPALAINVSPRELRRASFARDVVRTATREGMALDRLLLEITESAWTVEASHTMGTLHELERHGVLLAIDDFGAGYSSLSRLRELPAGVIKIDRAFMEGVPGDRDATAIVEAIVQIAVARGCYVVAEGIEDEPQAALLNQLGCGLGQGYHLGRPLPFEEITPLLHDGLIDERVLRRAA